MQNETVAHVLAAGLKRHGVSMIFGQSIPVGLFHVTPQYGIRQVAYRAENAGGIMADGYARISGQIGVVCAQNGPAATLLVAPLAEALKASVPVLAIVEEVPRGDVERNAFQEFDHLALFSSCTKWARRLDRAERAADFLDMAVTAATSGRPGPVALMVPRDLFREPAAAVFSRTENLGYYPLDRYAPEPARVAEAAAILAAAKRPIIVAGGGVHLSNASAEVVALSRLTSIPVATTNMGKGVIDESSPLSLGVFGNTMGSAAGVSHLRAYATEADVVLFVGCRTNENGTNAWKLYNPDARFIHVDMDPREIGRNYEAFRLVGDAKTTIAGLTRALSGHNFTARDEVRDKIARDVSHARQAQASDLKVKGKGSVGAIRPEHLMQVLDQRLAPDDIVVADASYSTNWLTTYLKAKRDGARFLLPRGLAGLGWGFPLAMGAKLARPEAQVFAIVGDGGFAHCWAELEAAKRMGVNVTAIVLNNAILGFQCHGENAFTGGHSNAVDLGPVDHAAIARACGCHGERIEDPDDFADALARCQAAGIPAVLEIMTDPAAAPPLGVLEGRTVTGERID